jgi:hypothetical protein
MDPVLSRLHALYGDVAETLRITDGGIWHPTPLNVLSSAVQVIEREGLVRRRTAVLDAGAGDGRVLAALALGLASFELELAGIECDAALVELSRERLARLPNPPAVFRGDYLTDLPRWPALTIHYPDGNERAVLRAVDARGGAGARLILLSSELEPDLGRAPDRAFEVRPPDQLIAWSLRLYEGRALLG